MSKQLNWLAACVSVAAVGTLSATPSQAQWGSIKGQVVVSEKVAPLPLLAKKGDSAVKDSSVCAAEDLPDESLVIDAETNGLANVVIWLPKKPTKVHPDLAKSKEEEVTFDQKGCRFLPHVLLVRTDQRVRVTSNDSVAHNTHTYPLKNKPENFIVSANDKKGVLLPAQSLEERLPAKVGCDIHPWMQAWWVVLDHPYAAVTNEKGEFEIADLPIGEHEFKVWQERAGYLEKSYKVFVKPGDNKLAPVKVSPSSLKK